jgi:hypothetical protein
MRFSCHEGAISDDVGLWVYDADQRRWITVCFDYPMSWLLMGREAFEEVRDEEWEKMKEKAQALVEEHIDIVVADDIVGINASDSGGLTFVTAAGLEYEDHNKSTYYPLLAEYQLPSDSVRTVLRSEITELDRLSAHVDLVSYPGVEKGVFKYSHHHGGYGAMWQQIHIHARLGKHAHILPLECLVLDEVSGTRVVGFTTPLIAGGDLDTNKDRLFKLKHLRQLMQVDGPLTFSSDCSLNTDMAATPGCRRPELQVWHCPPRLVAPQPLHRPSDRQPGVIRFWRVCQDWVQGAAIPPRRILAGAQGAQRRQGRGSDGA